MFERVSEIKHSSQPFKMKTPNRVRCLSFFFFLAVLGFSSIRQDLWFSLWHAGSFSCSMWDLVPWPGTELGTPAFGAWSLKPLGHQGSPNMSKLNVKVWGKISAFWTHKWISINVWKLEYICAPRLLSGMKIKMPVRTGSVRLCLSSPVCADIPGACYSSCPLCLLNSGLWPCWSPGTPLSCGQIGHHM